MLRSTLLLCRQPQQKLLFTPGPLLVTDAVKQAMQIDYGSRDTYFMETVSKIRQGVVDIAGISSSEEKAKWTCVPMQGSGTMGVEAAISTCAPRKNPKALVVCNGAYGIRHTNICRRLGIETSTFEFAEGAQLDLQKFEDAIKNTKDLTTFVTVHSETSTGVINPIEDMTPIVKRHHPNATVIVDAMSSFGGFPIETDKVADVLVSSFNKCIQGVPGASLCLARKDFLTQVCKNQSRSFTLDLTMQFEALEKSGQFPFTPPTHVITAFRQALEELEQEGGVEARYKRFKSNSDYVIDEMLDIGFSLFIKDRKAKHLGPFIVPFDFPQKETGWEFTWFYEYLKDRNCVIYPGKASKADTFRIGCIGDLHREDFKLLIESVKGALKEKNISLKK